MMNEVMIDYRSSCCRLGCLLFEIVTVEKENERLIPPGLYKRKDFGF
jgi:hypothetical protein